MIPAVKPIIMDNLLPEFTVGAANIPSYLRRGLSLDDVLAGKAPAKPSPVIASPVRPDDPALSTSAASMTTTGNPSARK